MKTLTFATGNDEKFVQAQSICAKYDVKLSRQTVEIDEIQGEDTVYVLRDKAARTFELLGEPVIVSDDAWAVPALNGFPGAYMKSIDHWFTPQDWFNLMRDHDDRSIILHQQLAYHDGTDCHVFTYQHAGQILREPRGTNAKTLQQVVTMDGDDGLSIGEVLASDRDLGQRDVSQGWRRFLDWYTSRND